MQFILENKKGSARMNTKKIIILFSLLVMFFTSCGIVSRKLPSLIPYRVGEKWGYCDINKKIVIKPAYDEAGFFSEGLARVKLNDKYGYINEKGEVIIPPQFDIAYDFHNGLARVAKYINNEEKFGYIDKSGKIVVNLAYDVADDFENGLAKVGIVKPNSPSYINSNNLSYSFIDTHVTVM